MSSTANHVKQTTIKEEDEACVYAIGLSHTSTLLMVMKGAIELDLFEIISKLENASASEIVSHLPTQNPDASFVLERVLHLLVSYSLLTCTLRTREDGKVEKLYGLAPAGKYFVRDVNGGSFIPLFNLQCQGALMEVLYNWKDAVLNGGCVNEASKTSVHQYTDTNPLTQFINDAMTGTVRVTMKRILDIYTGFEGLKSLVDIGGGNGTTIDMIISKYPTIKGINFDLPHVIKDAPPSYHGIEQVGGDMFESIPKGEAILLKNVIHNWSDEHCLKLLRNCYQVLPENGKLIIIESLLPIVPETDVAGKYVSLVDTFMVSIIKGKERTKQEFVALCKGAGFSEIQFVCCACTYWVMEVYK